MEPKDTTVEIDEATGLPSLPADKFWEVCPSGGYLTVKLNQRITVTNVKKKWIFFSNTVTTEEIETIDKNWVDLDRRDDNYAPIELTDEWVRSAVLEKATSMCEEIQREARQEAVISSIIGVYPPKKL